MKTIKNSDGFSPVHTLLILVILAIVGFTGWYVWNANQQANRELDSTRTEDITTGSSKQANTANKPAKTLSAYSDKSFGLSFDYQKSWQFTDGSSDLRPTLMFKSPDYKQVESSGMGYISEGGEIEVTLNKTTSTQFIVDDGEYFYNGDDGQVYNLDYFSYVEPIKISGIDGITGTCGHNNPGTCSYVIYKGKVFGFGYYQPKRGIAGPTQTAEDKYSSEYNRLIGSVKLL